MATMQQSTAVAVDARYNADIPYNAPRPYNTLKPGVMAPAEPA